MVGSLFRSFGRGREALLKVRVGSGGPPSGPQVFPAVKSGRESLLVFQEGSGALPEVPALFERSFQWSWRPSRQSGRVRVGSGGRPGVPGGFGRTSCMSRKGLGDPLRGTGGVGRTSRMFERSRRPARRSRRPSRMSGKG